MDDRSEKARRSARHARRAMAGLLVAVGMGAALTLTAAGGSTLASGGLQCSDDVAPVGCSFIQHPLPHSVRWQ